MKREYDFSNAVQNPCMRPDEFIWDEQAEVWIYISKEIPGLVLEAETLKELVERIPSAKEDLLSLSK